MFGGGLADTPGLIYTSTDSGATWTRVTLPNRPPLGWAAVACSADGNKLMAALNGQGIYTAHSTPTPVLGIAPSGTKALLSWTIPSMDFTLQQNSDLSSTNWTDVPTRPILNLTNLQNQVIVAPTNGNTFYRLKH